MKTIHRPALKFYGGKFRLARWILPFFPPHTGYIEPCGGAGSVLLLKSRSKLEVYNDLDGNVVNYFRVLRDNPEELIRRIKLTPWARGEYELHHLADSDPIEMARRFWVGCAMSIPGTPFTSSGMAMDKNKDGLPGKTHAMVAMGQEHLYVIAERLLGVQIENKPYQEILEMYDHPDNLIYMDPPYVPETRKKPRQYAFEWAVEQHIEAAGLLKECEGYIVLSGYRCSLYDELYEGWPRFDKEAQTTGGKRIESLWLSPRTFKALEISKQLSLF